MTYKRLLPIIIITSLVSAIYVLIAQTVKVSAVWLPFICWTLFVLEGSNPKRLPNLIFGFTAGTFIGTATVLLPSFLSMLIGTVLALPVTVFIMVFIILSVEPLKPVNSIPSYFLAYSSYFAYYFGNFGGKTQTPMNVIPSILLLSAAGFFLGILTGEIRSRLLKK